MAIQNTRRFRVVSVTDKFSVRVYAAKYQRVERGTKMITSKEWGACTTTIAMRHEYDDAARAFCKSIPTRPSNGVVMVNADNRESFDATDHLTGWEEARAKWDNPNIAHPPIYVIFKASKAS